MRLIDADALMNQYERIDWYSASKSGGLMRGATSEDNPVIHYYDGEEVIKNAPTIEADPVRHGSVIETIEDGRMKRVFSCCGTDFTKMTCWMMPNYCPNCGAKLRGGADDVSD